VDSNKSLMKSLDKTSDDLENKKTQLKSLVLHQSKALNRPELNEQKHEVGLETFRLQEANKADKAIECLVGGKQIETDALETHIMVLQAELVQEKENVNTIENDQGQNEINQDLQHQKNLVSHQRILQSPLLLRKYSSSWSLDAAPAPAPVKELADRKQKEMDALEARIMVLEAELAQEKENVKKAENNQVQLEHQKKVISHQAPPRSPLLLRKHSQNVLIQAAPATAPMKKPMHAVVVGHSIALVKHRAEVARFEEELEDERNMSHAARIEVKHLRAATLDNGVLDDTASSDMLDNVSDMSGSEMDTCDVPVPTEAEMRLIFLLVLGIMLVFVGIVMMLYRLLDINNAKIALLSMDGSCDPSRTQFGSSLGFVD